MLGLTLATCSIAGNTFAMAQEGQVVTGAVKGYDVSGEKIDLSHPISLTVKKTGQNPYDDSQSGNKNVSGVKFTLSKVKNVDVTNDSVRKKVMNNYSYQYITDNDLPVVKVQDGVTDNKGFVSFTDLKPGLYILQQIGEETTPEVIMLPMVDSDGLKFHYDNLIVTKNFKDTPTPPPSTPQTPNTPQIPDTPQTTSEQETPHKTSEKNTPSEKIVQSTPSPIPPQDNTPPPGSSKTPLYPGGPKVETGGVGIPSLSGEGNMAISTIATILAIIFGVVGFGARRVFLARKSKK